MKNIIESKRTVDMLIAWSHEVMPNWHTEKEMAANDDEDYAVKLSVSIDNDSATAYRPSSVMFSYNKYLGYFMDIDNFTFEFGDDAEIFVGEAKKYRSALYAGKLRIVEKKFLGLIRRTDIEITE